MKIQDKYNTLRDSYKAALDEADRLIAEDKFEEAAAKQTEAEKLLSDLNVVKARLESAEVPALDETPARIPFATEEKEEKPQENPVTKAFYQARYGETEEAVKAVVTDIYGKNYNEQRYVQHRAFNKYLRYGFERMTAQEHGALTNLILLPEHIQNEVRQGLSVGEIKALKATQQESSLELGGALVPEDWRAEVIKRLAGRTIMRGRARQITTMRDAVEYPRLEGGGERYTSAVRVTWVDEVPASESVAETNFTAGMVRIPVHTVMARTNVSRNLLEDSGVDVMMLLAELFSEAMAVDEDEQFLVGRGGNTPRGVLGKGTVAQPAPDDGIGEVVSGAASAIKADNVINLLYEPDVQYTDNFIWLGNKTTFRDIRKLKDGNGDYLWAKGIERGAPATVLGHDYLVSQALPTVAANSYPLLFGDPRGYLIVDRVGMTVERVTDSTTIGRNYVAVFARRRLGGQVVAPWLFKAMKIAAS